MTRKDFQSHLPRCWQCGWRFENETTKITNYSRDFFFPNFHPLSVLGIQITRVWGYSLPPSGLIEIKRKSCDCIIFFCAPMPIYRVLFWSKFPAGSGHIIKCLLMWVWFGSRSWSKDLAALGPLVMTPSQILVPVRPYHSSNEYTVFRFCTSHCYH